MKLDDLRVGDVLRCPKIGTWVEHEGVYVGHGQVLHNTPEKGEHVGSVHDFCNGRSVTVESTQGLDTALFSDRVGRVIQNPSKYDLLSRNCQHTVTAVRNGVAFSWTVFVVGVLAVLGLVWCFKRK